MPEPAPSPDSEKHIDSAIIEQDYDGLPGLQDIKRDMLRDVENNAPADPGQSPESPAESPAEPPVPSASPAPECDEMQHDFANFDRVAPAAHTPPRKACVPALCPPPSLKRVPRKRNVSNFLKNSTPLKRQPA